MEMDVVKIGNSKGIRIPLAVLRQCGIDAKVELEVKENCLIIKPVKTPRQGWAEAFALMHKNGDDSPLIPEEIDLESLAAWDGSNR